MSSCKRLYRTVSPSHLIFVRIYLTARCTCGTWVHEDKQPTSPRLPCKSICETTLLEKVVAERYWHLIYHAHGKLNRHVCDANIMLVNVHEIYDSSNYISLYILIMYSCLRLNFLCKLEAVKGMNGP